MAEVRYSLLAEDDIDGITGYTVRKWSLAQADRYVGALEAFCERLAVDSSLARACNDIRPGLLRLEYERHVVFFRVREYGVRVVRILHERQLPQKHSFEDDETA
jgi:toxin ParE1/3/4